MFRSKIIPAILAATLGLGSAAAVFAANGANQNHAQQEAIAIQNAKTSLVQAIAAAEQHTGGKAIESGIENQNGKIIAYEVKVVTGNTVQEVLVDLGTGQVMKVTAAKSEHAKEKAGKHKND